MSLWSLSRAHLLAHELGDFVVHLLVEEHLGKGRNPKLERAVLPHLLQHLAPLLGRQVRPFVNEVVLETRGGVWEGVLELLETCFVDLDLVGTVFQILHRDDVLRRPHEHRQMLDLARNGLYDLDAGRADPDDADALAGEVDRLLRPAAGVHKLPRECVLPGKHIGEGRR